VPGEGGVCVHTQWTPSSCSPIPANKASLPSFLLLFFFFLFLFLFLLFLLFLTSLLLSPSSLPHPCLLSLSSSFTFLFIFFKSKVTCNSSWKIACSPVLFFLFFLFFFLFKSLSLSACFLESQAPSTKSRKKERGRLNRAA
jgi:hypothetical protein